ncbi:ligand-binding sensor domain-containing protein [Paraclostridium bifermentans]|uniref:ligand-binding sensor domain-containing protein n=3 Tax=Paraclostridium bifermentans TaxID=1490 RepID=UPI0021C2EB80|nr:sensor histidine kinase [Paraclostridium bifermentans]
MVKKKDPKKGIANSYIIDIKEDKKGNLWVATIGGVSKINTETDSIKNYYNSKDNGNLSDSSVYDILINKDGKVLIATANGVDIYDEKNDKFKPAIKNLNQLKSKHIYDITEDDSGNYWIGTKKGLYKFDKKYETVEQFLTKDTCGKDLTVYKVYFDGDKNLWVGTRNENLYKIDTKTNKIKEYDPPEGIDKNSSIRDILQDKNKELWIATDSGLVKYDKLKDKFRVYQKGKYDVNGLTDNLIFCIMEDKSGLLWLGTYSGISIFDSKTNINYYKHDPNPEDKTSISDNMVSGIYKDNDGVLWVGTNSEGVTVLNREKEKTYYIKREDGLSSNKVYDIKGKGDIIVISTDDGLNVINKKEKTLKVYNKDNGLKNSNIRSVLIDDDNKVWLGTTEGVLTLNISTGEIVDMSSLSSKYNIEDKLNGCIYKDSNGMYWVGYFLDGGLLKFDPKTQKTKLYRMRENDSNSISNNSVRVINEDKQGNLWIGTNYGLNKFNPKTEKFEVYTIEDGLPNNTIYGIVIDKSDHIWVSTNYGLSKFDYKKNEFTNFDIVDGLQGREFNGKSFNISDDGEIFFGGTNGLNSFRCEELKKKKYYIDLSIGDIYVNEKRYNSIEDVNFKFNENNISIKMFLPYYKNMRDTKYYYKIEGVDKDFKDVKSNKLNLVNLNPGKYTLKLKAINNNVAESNEKTIEFSIKPPIWKSKIAMVIYGVICIFAILYYDSKVKLLDSMVNKRTKALTKEIEKNENLFNKVLSLEKKKNSYFVNLSHELRTPLNVISSTEQLISIMLDKKGLSKDNLKYHMSVINKNAERLLELITNLMDIEKIEYGKYKINKTKQDIVEVIENEALRLKNHVECKGIELIIDPEIEEKIVSFDKIEIKRCIENLISNAVKYTPEGGTIELGIKDHINEVEIYVKDNGIGIDEEHKKIIFDRFRQVVDANEEIQNSSGLGLTITKEIVNLHGGEIYIESEFGKGSKFIIILPIE